MSKNKTTLGLALLSLSLFFAHPPLARASDFVTEQFNQPIQYKQPGVPSNYYWWAIDDSDGQQYYGNPCDPQNVACLTRIVQDGEKFARLSIGHDLTPQGYNNVEFSELQTGYVYHQGLERWSPTVDHPVIFTETVKFGPNYNENGTGGAIGSAGGGLWNSYVDFPNSTLHPITAFWWGWAEQGMAFGQLEGLSLSVFNENNLLYFQKVTAPLDMHDWMTWVESWKALPNGKQEISFTVFQNGHLYTVGNTHDFYPDGVGPLPALSVTNWNDNQFVNDFDQFGNPIVVFHNPAVGQTDYWDLNGITVFQP